MTRTRTERANDPRARPWLQLVLGMLANAAGTVVVSCPVFLIPHLHLTQGFTLVEAGLFAAAPTIGTLLTLIAWGAIVDRIGERAVIGAGLAIMTIGALAASLTDGLVAWSLAFFVCGVGAASTNSASGRLVVGWFAPQRRGLAMGIRQTALPLGMGVTALVVPIVVEKVSVHAAIVSVTVIGAVVLVVSVLGILDPPRTARHEAPAGELANPYRGVPTLPRIHAASALLVVPQFVVWTFMLVWLIDARGWSTTSAAGVVAAGHALAIVGRVGAGWWSDRAGSRLAPMRTIAWAAAASMLAVGLLDPTVLAVPAMLLAATIVVADNGLAFTSVAEIAGPFWSGRALGIQNTGQYAVSALVPPAAAWLITHSSYSTAFMVAALFAAAAIPVIPSRPEGLADHH